MMEDSTRITTTWIQPEPRLVESVAELNEWRNDFTRLNPTVKERFIETLTIVAVINHILQIMQNMRKNCSITNPDIFDLVGGAYAYWRPGAELDIREEDCHIYFPENDGGMFSTPIGTVCVGYVLISRQPFDASRLKFGDAAQSLVQLALIDLGISPVEFNVLKVPIGREHNTMSVKIPTVDWAFYLESDSRDEYLRRIADANSKGIDAVNRIIASRQDIFEKLKVL